MRANDLCPSPHLEAADFDGDTIVTIKGWEMKKVGRDQKVEKGVLFFEEFDRGMVLNRTNLHRLIRQLGKDAKDWIGKQVTLYPSETDFNQQTVPCIRVREK